MLEVENISKSYGTLKAVDNVSFQASVGEVVGFLGPNGAGKSTTMKILTGFITPSSGTAKIFGFDITEDPTYTKDLIGYLPEGAPAYQDMTVSKFLKFIAEIRGFNKEQTKKRVEYITEAVNLTGVFNQRIETLSKGYRRRVGLAQAMLHDPKVLILDEPTDGLDPNQKHEVRMLINKIAKDKIIILSTHILEEVEAVCDRAIVISQGKIVADSTPSELAARSPLYNTVLLKVEFDDPGEVQNSLSNVEWVDSVEAKITTDNQVEVLLHPNTEYDFKLLELSQIMADNSWKINEIATNKGHLNEVFRNITRG